MQKRSKSNCRTCGRALTLDMDRLRGECSPCAMDRRAGNAPRKGGRPKARKSARAAALRQRSIETLQRAEDIQNRLLELLADQDEGKAVQKAIKSTQAAMKILSRCDGTEQE